MSTLKVNTLEEATVGGATFYTTKAWITFNGNGTVAILESGGISSLTDIGTGEYGPNFASVMSNADYSVSGTSKDNTATNACRAVAGASNQTNTTSVLKVLIVPLNTSAGHVSGADASYVALSVHI